MGTLPRQAAPLPHPVPESTWTRPRDGCPHPGRWSSYDSDSTELEVTALVAGFVRALQPDLVVETGTAWGQTAEAVGRALACNGQGRLVTFEVDRDRVVASLFRCQDLPVDVVDRPSLDGIADLPAGTVGFAWLDSLFDLRLRELEALRPKLGAGAVVGLHDTGPQHPLAGQLDGLRGWRRIDLPTPRGVTFLQPC